ncbi:MAG: 3'(2'),5'-bisphosphate nucleotidase CysQ [Pseudomonadota bacterium]
MPAPDGAADRDLLMRASQAAGDIALKYFGADPASWEKEDGAGPVTVADLEVDAALREALTTARPDYGWLSEETEDGRERLSKRRVFIVDPIDGTRSFIEGSRTWALSLAVVEDGAPVAAVVYLPARDLLYEAARGSGARLNGQALFATDARHPAKARVLASKSTFRDALWRRAPPLPHLTFRSSLAYRMATIAQGRFDAMITLRRTWEWDVAAGALLVTEAGGQVATTKGPPRFNSAGAWQPGILAGGPSLISTYLERAPRVPAPAA